MKRSQALAIASAAVAGMNSIASAGIMENSEYKVEQPSNIEISFVSASNDWNGSLYFSGYELGGIMHRAENSDRYALGSYLFDNFGTDTGYTMDLGQFDTGSILHFSFLVYRGNKDAGIVGYTLQTESPDDLSRFSFAEINPIADSIRTTSLSIAAADGFRGDLQVNVVARVIPSPGATGMLWLAAGFCVARRRRLI